MAGREWLSSNTSSTTILGKIWGAEDVAMQLLSHQTVSTPHQNWWAESNIATVVILLEMCFGSSWLDIYCEIRACYKMLGFDKEKHAYRILGMRKRVEES
jgi:hypothetical protein